MTKRQNEISAYEKGMLDGGNAILKQLDGLIEKARAEERERIFKKVEEMDIVIPENIPLKASAIIHIQEVIKASLKEVS